MDLAHIATSIRRALQRGVLIGAMVGALLGGATALAWTVVAHTAALWHHGMNAEDATGDGHPFLDSTDGTHRAASAAYQVCYGGSHSPDGQYIHRGATTWTT